MRTKPRSVVATPVPGAEIVRPKTHDTISLVKSHDRTEPAEVTEKEHADKPVRIPVMSQANGTYREQTPVDIGMASQGRVISSSMMRQAALEPTPPPDPSQWSSAVGHASTGKSGRVIERLQQEIDRLNREKHLLKLQYEESERTKETLNTSISYLRDRNSNYESSHESNIRQIQRKERQVEELKVDLQREKSKTQRAEEAARTAVANEDDWREQASQAKAIAQHKEVEYDAIASCRNMDNDRHQNGINRIRAHLEELQRKRADDLEKQKRMEIIAEQQRQTIRHLEELNNKLTANFKIYRNEIDAAVDGLRESASGNDQLVQSKVEEMRRVTGEMKWVMNVETIINGKRVPPRPPMSEEEDPVVSAVDSVQIEQRPSTTRSQETVAEVQEAPPSPTKKMSLDFRRHRRKASSKTGK